MCSDQEKSKRYPSIYSPDKFVAFPQYLAEKMCQRRATSLGRDLPKQFWKTLPEWKTYFFYQLKLANSLSKKYRHDCIFKAINELKYIYSLGIKKLISTIEACEKAAELKTEQVVDLSSFPGSGRFNRPKSKLEDLDG